MRTHSLIDEMGNLRVIERFVQEYDMRYEVHYILQTKGVRDVWTDVGTDYQTTDYAFAKEELIGFYIMQNQ